MITEYLRAAQKPIERYLWVPADAITFTPAVVEQTFGDGRALFAVSTVYNRPAFWIVRGCSSWATDTDFKSPEDAANIYEFIDYILTAIEDDFGSADYYEFCCKSGRWRDEETKQFVPSDWAEYPSIDTQDGCQWGRLNWPTDAGLELEQHPFARCNIISKQSAS